MQNNKIGAHKDEEAISKDEKSISIEESAFSKIKF